MIDNMAIEILLIVAGIYAVLGAIGLFRFPDFYTRTHAATMITVGGVCLGLLILALSAFWSVYSLKSVIVIVLIFFTSPTATHAIANAAYKKGIKPKHLVKNELEEKK